MQRRSTRRAPATPPRDERGERPPRRGGSGGDGGKKERFRLTGLWQSRSNAELFTGRVDAEKIEALQQLCEQCLNGSGQLVLFMYENTRKRGPRDAEFAVYADESREYQGRDNDRGRGNGNGGRNGHRGRQIEQDDQDKGGDDEDDRF